MVLSGPRSAGFGLNEYLDFDPSRAHSGLTWRILKVSKLVPDQFSIFRPTFLELSGNSRWGQLDELSRAICLRNAWGRSFMTGRPAAHWADFGVLPLQTWVRLVARLSITN